MYYFLIARQARVTDALAGFGAHGRTAAISINAFQELRSSAVSEVCGEANSQSRRVKDPRCFEPVGSRVSAVWDLYVKKSKFSEEQIVRILKEGEAGAKVAETGRKHGISEPTYYAWKSTKEALRKKW